MYPALTTWQALKNKLGQDLDTLWIGSEGGMEADLVKQTDLTYRTIPAAGLHGVGLRAIPGNISRLLRGFREAQKILHEFKPDILFFTGGYLAVPVALAGRNISKVLYVPDIEPAFALRTLAQMSQKIALTVEESRSYFSDSFQQRLVVTGYPIRPDLKTWTRQTAFSYFQLEENIPVILVTGGSKGARSINQALLKFLPDLLPETQIVHISGNTNWAEIKEESQKIITNFKLETLTSRYHLMPYLHEMGAALAAADLVISRAGASSLGEYPYFGLPAVLIPYPHAWQYQKTNASYLEKRGAAIILPDDVLNERLFSKIHTLLNEPGNLEQMRKASQSLAKPSAAEDIANLIVDEMERRRGIRQ